jgi:hypothetical protein
MKNNYLPFFALILAVSACKKSSTTTPNTPDVYIDITAGIAKKYQTTNNLTAAVTTNTQTSTSRDSSINGKIYHVFTNSNGTANEYYNITGNDYYTFRSLGAALANLTVESIYLKDNAAVGTSWSQLVSVPVTGIPTGASVTLTNTITEKGISRTVSGITYTNVIHITTTIAVAGLPASSITTDIQSYYAAKAGLIEGKNKLILPLLTTNVDQVTILIP